MQASASICVLRSCLTRLIWLKKDKSIYAVWTSLRASVTSVDMRAWKFNECNVVTTRVDVRAQGCNRCEYACVCLTNGSYGVA